MDMDGNGPGFRMAQCPKTEQVGSWVFSTRNSQAELTTCLVFGRLMITLSGAMPLP